MTKLLHSKIYIIFSFYSFFCSLFTKKKINNVSYHTSICTCINNCIIKTTCSSVDQNKLYPAARTRPILPNESLKGSAWHIQVGTLIQICWAFVLRKWNCTFKYTSPRTLDREDSNPRYRPPKNHLNRKHLPKYIHPVQRLVTNTN